MFSFRVEIIRLSDKSFKETIKDVELSSYRSTTKEGYVSLDPSKPLPHEFEEGKLSRYNENIRQKYSAQNELNAKQQQELSALALAEAAAAVAAADDDAMAVDHEEKMFSQYANDSVLLNKTEFREILMNALAGNGSYYKRKFSEHTKRTGSIESNASPTSPLNDDSVVEKPSNLDQREKLSESIIALESSLVAGFVATGDADDDVDQGGNNKNEEKQKEQRGDTRTSDEDEIIYPNETIIKETQLSNDIEKKTTKPISLDAPEVDKLLNEGNLLIRGKREMHKKFPLQHISRK